MAPNLATTESRMIGLDKINISIQFAYMHETSNNIILVPN